MCVIWNLHMYLLPIHRRLSTWARRIQMNANRFFDLFCGKLPMTSVKCSAPQSTSAYQILSGTERERKASISWSVVPETAPCPDFTLAFCDWGHAVMYFPGSWPQATSKASVCAFLLFLCWFSHCVAGFGTEMFVWNSTTLCHKRTNIQSHMSRAHAHRAFARRDAEVLLSLVKTHPLIGPCIKPPSHVH